MFIIDNWLVRVCFQLVGINTRMLGIDDGVCLDLTIECLKFAIGCIEFAIDS